MNRFAFILGTVGCLAIAVTTNAAVTIWTVQSASSSLTLSGALSTGGTFLASAGPQAAGSLTTAYNGTLQTTSNVSGGVPQDISLTSSLLMAIDNGSWDPLPNGTMGTSLANYGVKFDFGFLGIAFAALRDLSVEVTSASAPLSGIPYGSQTFTANLDMELLSGTANFRLLPFPIPSPPPSPPYALAGTTDTYASAASISYGPGGEAGIATLTLPIELSFSGIMMGADTTSTNDDITMFVSLSGNIMATAPTATVPEASSLVLLGLAGSFVGFAGYRRRFQGAA